MNIKLSYGLLGVALVGSAYAQEGLYSVGQEPDTSIPFHWSAGTKFIYDDNVMASGLNEQDNTAVSPYVGASMISITPQTLVEIYAKLGLIYYFDDMTTNIGGQSISSTNSQSRLNLLIRHNISERLGITSTNAVAYELEPNYSYGLANSRQMEEHLFFSTDNYVSYRWTERLSTRTGFNYSGLRYDKTSFLDRDTIGGYQQFRYELQPLSILTAEYRYSTVDGGGAASDADNHYLLLGIEHRFSPNTVGQFRVGAQMRDVANGDSSTSPFLQGSLRTIINEQFSINSFLRYAMEDNDTVFGGIEFDERKTMRFGLEAQYKISPQLIAFSGVNYILTDYESGHAVIAPYTPVAGGFNEDLVNAHVGLTYKINDNWSCSLSYDYTDSNSDALIREYDRQRVSIGVDCRF